ncbi:hypothetical protein [Cupriavidus basilensis]|uniref:hypothetical protein n=1 Tax=Cupriavidus basilensis TaxID=68895 RepID=UPI0020A6A66F|nr:hypothetical protein [Cupriavidus basilensis]MCP3023404.1 hypothetical protein [Cupriavidus basilensis]
MKIIPTLVRVGLCYGIGATLTGCMTSTPVYDTHFGEAVRTARVMQTLNPQASLNTDPVTGVDGRAATTAMDRYNSSFRAPQSDPNGYTVGIGTSGGSLSTMGQ